MYDISYMIQDEEIFSNRNYPRLISFPRTGSHWLRLLIEAYTFVPCAVQSFFVKNPKKCWGIHIHNRMIKDPHPSEGPVINLGKVIYLYRNPVDVIWSNLVYDGKSPELADVEIERLIHEYKDHLERWLGNPEDIKEICYITYEDLKENSIPTLKKVLHFLDFPPPDEGKLSKIYQFANLHRSNLHFKHDPKIITNRQFGPQKKEYFEEKSRFIKKYKDKIEKEFEGLLK